MKTSMHDFVNGCLVALFAGMTALVGVAVGYKLGVKDTQQSIVAQCTKSEFYFFEGVGIMCPSVRDNNKVESK